MKRLKRFLIELLLAPTWMILSSFSLAGPEDDGRRQQVRDLYINALHLEYAVIQNVHDLIFNKQYKQALHKLVEYEKSVKFDEKSIVIVYHNIAVCAYLSEEYSTAKDYVRKSFLNKSMLTIEDFINKIERLRQIVS